MGAPAPPPWSAPHPPADEQAPDEPAAEDEEHLDADPPLPWTHQPYGVDGWGSRGTGYAPDPFPSQPGYRRYGRYRRYQGAVYRPGLRRPPSSPQALGLLLLVLGLFFVGLPYPLFAAVALAAAIRARRRTTQSFRVGPARTWLVYAVVFAVLGATSITLFAVVGSSQPAAQAPPMVDKTVALGQSATVLDMVTNGSEHFVPVTVTVDAVSPDGLPGTPDNTRLTYRVCAGPDAVSVFQVTSSLLLQPTAGQPIVPDGLDLPDLTLAAGHCLSGQQSYDVPAGTTLASAHYGILQTITWPLGPPPGG